jgi:hypothetical protein
MHLIIIFYTFKLVSYDLNFLLFTSNSSTLSTSKLHFCPYSVAIIPIAETAVIIDVFMVIGLKLIVKNSLTQKLITGHSMS